jgi:oleandomycin transport system ATP-binding protein
MRRRLDLAASLVGRPPVLVLDEPTTGLDPRSRVEVWELVRGLVAEGTAVLLTTQSLEEADRLATQIAVLDHGRVIEQGTPAALKARVGGQTLDVRPAERAQLQQAAAILAQVTGAAPTQDGDAGTVSVPVDRRLTGSQALTAVTHQLEQAGIAVTEVGLRLASLDQVFLALTGHRPEQLQKERR